MNFPAISSRCAAEPASGRWAERDVDEFDRKTRVLHEALLWAAVALGGLALFYFFDDLRSTFGPDGGDTATAGRSEPKPASGGFAGEVRLKADARGHFMFPAEVNGRSADFVADTGATLVVLTYEDAARLGLSPQRLDFNGRAETANGTARVAPVTLDRVRVEDITIRNVPAVTPPGCFALCSGST